MANLTEEELAEARLARPSAKRFEKVAMRSGEVWLSNPTRASWRRFQKTVAGDQSLIGDALEQIVIDVLVKPDVKTLQTWLDDFPGQLAGDVAGAISRLAGASNEDLAK